jgi:chorismate mutase
MTGKPQSRISTTSRIVSTLRELISALDRRVPHVERPGEIRIARDAQILRRQAVAQIEELSRQGPDDKPYDQELVEAIMTDDGGPPPESETNTRSSCVWKRTGLPRIATAADMLGMP